MTTWPNPSVIWILPFLDRGSVGAIYLATACCLGLHRLL
jgi:hypothetical protein